MSWQCIVKLPL